MTDFANILSSNLNNGDLIIGIGAGIDAALADVDKLRVPSGSIVVNSAVDFSVSFFEKNLEPVIEEIVTSSIAAIYAYGVLELTGSDITVVNANEPGLHMREITIDKVRIQKAMTLICATKLNFFCQNHHTGQGALTGLPLKVFNSLYNINAEIAITPEITSVIHKVGHWASTRIILRKLGIPDISNVRGVPGLINLEFGPDFKIRNTMMPAGTGSLALCFAILKKMKSTKLIYAVEDPTMISRVSEAYWRVFDHRAKYHLSALYLTGQERLAHDDNEFTSILGFLGSFIVNLYPSSSICKSPRIKRGINYVYKDYEGYSESFESLCNSVKKAMSKGIRGDIQSYLPMAEETVEGHADAINSALANSRFE